VAGSGNILMEKLLDTVVSVKASDLHITVGQPPVVRHHARMRRLETKVLDNDDTTALMKSITPDRCQQELQEKGGCDFAIEFVDGYRFRVAIFKQRGNIGMVLRRIPSQFLSFEQIGMPDAVRSLIVQPRGLLLVTGPTGSGKTTSLASMVNFINHSYDRHIITLEDPIEYILTSKNCHVTQREIFTHSESFATALRASLREDPDVIMVGEMRDLETISLAITAAETGHLVLATLHTSNASRTLDRLLDVFPPHQQEQIRVMVSESLRGVISHQLIPRADGTGRVLALEILTNTPAVANVIREAKTYMLPGIIQTGKKQGMRLMDDALIELCQRGLISAQEAYARADQKQMVRQQLRM
jgi:twitching motility protein PilT